MGLGLAGAQQLFAQSDRGVNLDHVLMQGLNDRLRTEIFFRLDPRFFENSDPSAEATLTLQSQPGTTYPVSVRASDSPYYVVVILGNGATSEENFFQLQDYANQIVSAAPGAPQFAIIEYSNFVGRVLPDFIPVKNQIISNINQLQPSDRENLCLLDAVTDGINLLNSTLSDRQQIPKAVVVLGVEDEIQTQFKANGCNADRQSVAAYANESNVQVHSVNFSANSGSDNDPLKLLSDFTNGTSLNSGTSSFSNNQSVEILDNLNQQWVAAVDLFPTEGDQLATLTLDVSGTPAVTSFQFTSPRLFEKPLGQPEITLASFRYDEEKDLYFVEVDIDNLQLEDGNIRFQMWAKESSTIISEQTTLGLDPSKIYVIPTDRLEANKEYTLQIIPLNKGNQPLRDNENKVIIIENPFTYLPKIIPPPAVLIKSIVPNGEEGFATLNFETANVEPDSTLAGYFNNAQNTKEGEFGPMPIAASGTMTVPLPIKELKTEGPLDYTIILAITNPDTQTGETEYEFSYLPKQPPGFIGRNLGWIALIFLAIAAITGYFYFRNKNKQEDFDLPGLMDERQRPARQPKKKEPSDSAVRKIVKRMQTPLPSAKKSNPPPPRKKKKLEKNKVKNQNIFIKVIKSNNNDLVDKKYLITDLPFTLGRKYFMDDPLISGSHLEIGADRNGLYIKDLGSSNGTFVGEKAERKLVPNKAFDDLKASPPTKIRLGKRTTIILQFDESAFKNNK